MKPEQIVSELQNIFTGEPLPQAAVKTYNQYSHDINQTSYKESKEQLRDNRHKFYVMVCNLTGEPKR